MAGLQYHHANYRANDWLKANKEKFLWFQSEQMKERVMVKVLQWD